MLKFVMEKNGFKGYQLEWWHYQLVNERFTKYPEEHFDFPVQQMKSSDLKKSYYSLIPYFFIFFFCLLALADCFFVYYAKNTDSGILEKTNLEFPFDYHLSYQHLESNRFKIIFNIKDDLPNDAKVYIKLMRPVTDKYDQLINLRFLQSYAHRSNRSVSIWLQSQPDHCLLNINVLKTKN